VTRSARPTVLAAAAVLVLVEAAGLVLYAVVAAVQALRGDRSSVLGALLLVLILLVWAAGLAVAARGLWQVRRWARSPVVVSELLLLAVGIPLVQGTGAAVGAVGVCVVALAVATTGAVLSPPATAALLP
jgi:hypothetical protein